MLTDTLIPEAYENAGVQGLCAEGRWELAVDAIKRLDLRATLASQTKRPVPGAMD
jgi:hypothetical protein